MFIYTCNHFLMSQSYGLQYILSRYISNMDKVNLKEEQRFNKAVEIYLKKYNLTIYSLIKFIEERIEAATETKNIVVSQILSTRLREESITKDDLKTYLHMLAAAQAKVDVRGKKIESFSHFYRLIFKQSKAKEESKSNSEAQTAKKQEKVEQKKKGEEKIQVEVKTQNKKNNKVQETLPTINQPNESKEEISKQVPHKKRNSRQISGSPKKELEIIVQDVIDQNRTSNVIYRNSQSTQQVLLKLPQAQMMRLKSQKSVQISGYDKFGQNYLNPIIKFHITFGDHSVYRRYSEFQRLMNDLGRRYEGFILPQLPPKEGVKSSLSYFWGLDEAFLNDRQVKLEEMLNTLLSSKFVNKDDILLKFLSDQDFEIEGSSEGGIISYLKPITSIGLNATQLKNYGMAYYVYLKEFRKSEINTIVTIKYKEVESLLSFCLTLDNYRNAINTNFEQRRDIFKELKMDQDDRNLTITKFDKLSSTTASEIKNLSKEINKYLQLKSQESWLNYLIREKESEAESNAQQLKKNKDEITNRINVMEANLMTSIEQLKQQKIEYLQSVGDKMIEWRKSIHP